MALVDYISSGDEHDVEESTSPDLKPPSPSAVPENLKRKREVYCTTTSDLPPLPTKFHDLYASTTRVSTRDDSSLHGGRKRIIPHVEGNWPTHLYIEWYPSTAEHEFLALLITSVQDAAAIPRTSETRIESLLTSDLGAPLPLHVSLSRPIVFTANQKDIFVASVHEKIATSGVRPFKLKFDDLDWVPNFGRTRWFLVLRLRKPEGNGLNSLLSVCNGTVEEFSQPPLYVSHSKQPCLKVDRSSRKRRRSDVPIVPQCDETLDFSSAFHISIAWTLGQPSSFAMDITKAAIDDEVFDALRTVSITVDAVKVKVGNIVTNICLPTKAAEGKSLFGL